MTTEPSVPPRAGADAAAAVPPPQRRTVGIAAAAMLVLLAIVVAVSVVRFRAVGAARPLPSSSNTLLLLVAPDTSLADWKNYPTAPALNELAFGNAAGGESRLGVMPANRAWIPWRSETAPNSLLWDPVTPDDLTRACGDLGGPAFGRALLRAGVRTVALGDDPAVRVLLGTRMPGGATGSGAFGTGYTIAPGAESWRIHQPEAIDGFRTDPALLAGAMLRAVPAPAATGSRTLIVAVFDDLLRADAYAPLTTPEAAAAHHGAALRRLNDVVDRLRAGVQPGTALLVITPLPATDAAARGDLFGPVLLWTPPAADGAATPIMGRLLTSPSTRLTPGLIAPADVPATILSLLGGARIGVGTPGIGRPAVVRASGGSAEDAAAALAARVDGWAAQLRAMRSRAYLPWLLAALLLAAVWSGAVTQRRAAVAAAACALPIILFASAIPVGGDLLAVTVGAAALALAATVGGIRARTPEALRRLLVGACAVAALGIVVDVLCGGPLLLAHSSLSYAPGLGARYYGVGNEISGILLGGALPALTGAGSDLGSVALGGLAVACTLGMPTLGADAGGFAAALAGFGTWIALRTAHGKRRRAGALAAGAAVAALALYVAGNAALPAGARTHVGEAALAGRHSLPLLRRKATTDFRLLLTSPWSALLLTEILLSTYLWRRRSPAPGDRETVIAVFATAGALLLLNDSGSAAAAPCLFPAVVYLALPPPPPADAAAGAAALRETA